MFYSFRKVMTRRYIDYIDYLSRDILEQARSGRFIPGRATHNAAALPRKVCIEVLSESIYVYFTDKTKNNSKSVCFLKATRFTSRYISG